MIPLDVYPQPQIVICEFGVGVLGFGEYRCTSLIRKRTPSGPYCRPMPRVIGGCLGDGRFLMGEEPLYGLRYGVSGFGIRGGRLPPDSGAIQGVGCEVWSVE